MLVSDNPTLALDAVGPSTPTIHGDGGILEGLTNGGDEGTAHVADDLGNAAWRAAVLDQKRTEPGNRLLAASGCHEQHRFAGAVEVDEHGHVGMAPLGCGLVQANGCDAAEVQPLDRAADIVLDDAP